MVIILAGAIGRFPVGGQAWCEMQYLLGLRDLQHEVYFLEDCGEESSVYNWESEQVTNDLDYPTSYVRHCLDPIGLGDRWIYRVGQHSVGMPQDEFLDVCARADLFIIRGAIIPQWRSEYDLPRRRIFIDCDPAFVQMGVANGNRELAATIEQCDRLFTIGQNIGSPRCPIPTLGKEWLKTVLPVALDYWPAAENGAGLPLTSVLQWRSYGDVIHEGINYGNKDREFPKFMSLPGVSNQPFRIALTGALPEMFTEHGWEVVPGWAASQTPVLYQKFIQDSRAEFSVAKQGYVATRSGWFSDRSACYLASGRPVLIQDTGISDWLPTGEGVVTFRDLPEALRGIEIINADYEHHRHLAKSLVEEYFASHRVLPLLLAEAMA